MRSWRSVVGDVTLGVVTLVALGLGGYRLKEVISGPPDPYEPVEVQEWKRYSDRGNRIGAQDATVTIVEFSDFQCPFCRSAHTDLKKILAEFNDEVA